MTNLDPPSASYGQAATAELQGSSAEPSARTIEEEFTIFVQTRERALLAFAYAMTGNHHDAQDLVQLALTKTYQRWRKLRRDHNLDAYVRKIIVNDNAGSWRRAWRRRERSSDGRDFELLADRRQTSGQQESESSVEAEAWTQVHELPKKQRAVIFLRFYEDLSVAETADIMGISEGTVKSQSSRALDSLRTHITAESEVI